MEGARLKKAEAVFKEDFSDVRVHTDMVAQRTAENLLGRGCLKIYGPGEDHALVRGEHLAVGVGVGVGEGQTHMAAGAAAVLSGGPGDD
ncbi:DUF4157 domain-containing protein [Streptomyces sp. NPDC047017]|uniref:eCIS core domain-containing protein n=1 Tax=Streptomyces sp. NPDC047017 TaxID=3155024 RepID=UPI0033E08F47